MKLIYSIGSKFGGSGIGRTAYYGAEGFYRRGYLKKVLCSSFQKGIGIPENRIVPVSHLINFIPFYTIKDNLYDFLASFHVNNCDVFYGWGNMSLRCMKKARKLGAKCVLNEASTHILKQKELFGKEHKKTGYGNSINKKTIIKELKEYSLSNLIIVPSKFAYESFIEQGIDDKKLALVPFGVDSNKFSPGKKKDDIFRVLFVGSVCQRKGIYHLLEAWKNLNLKNSELLIVGKIMNDAKEIVKKRTDNVRIIGWVPDLLETYRQSSLFTLPSIEEGSALVTYEAMACGLPSIVTKNTGSVVRNKKDGFVIPAGTAEALARKIQYIYDNRKEAKIMGRNARKRAEKYTWKRHGNLLVESLEKIF